MMRQSNRGPRRSANAVLAVVGLVCLAPISLVQAQSSNTHLTSLAATKKTSSASVVHVTTKSRTAHRIVPPVAKRAVVEQKVLSTPPQNGSLVASTITLHYAQAAEATALLRQVFKSGDVYFAPDARTNTILIRGTKQAVDQVATALDNLDQPSPSQLEKEPRILRIFKLGQAEAAVTAAIIRSSLTDAKAASISVDDRTNSLVVSAPENTLNRIAALLDQLDTPKGPELVPTMTVFHLQYAKAAETARTLSKTFANRKSAHFSSDDYSNTVILLSDQGTKSDVAKLLQQLDAPVEPSKSLSIFHLRYANAVAVAQVINKSLAASGMVIASADESTNSVIVNADERTKLVVSRLLTELDVSKR
jgi:type II secretory pathway component GspD/PulD (secretin)